HDVGPCCDDALSIEHAYTIAAHHSRLGCPSLTARGAREYGPQTRCPLTAAKSYKEILTMPKLTEQEQMAFLAERGHLARIATVASNGAPSVVPVWFIFEGGKILITPRKHSAFYQNIKHEPRVAITIDEDTGRYRKVLFQGKTEVLFEVGEDRKWDDV